MSRYIIYCRKSSESEERQVLSIESQIKELTDLANRLNLDVSEILTESKSAKYPGRSVFNEMMSRIYKGEVKGVICWKLDRLARNPIDGSALIWALDRGFISEITTSDKSFLNNSNDKFLMSIELGMAKKYVDDLSDNIKRGNRAKLERGWTPSLPPLGYLNEPTERTIVRDPERFNLARKMWDLLLQGVRPSKIRKITNEEWGLRTRTHRKIGGSPLSINCIYKMFGNPFYYGLITRKEGVFPGKHEPMITVEEYWRAQAILGKKGRPRPKTHQFSFTGLIRCGECGSMITAEEKDNRYGSHYVYYRCTKKKAGAVCHQRYINLKNLESQVLDYLSRIHVPERLLNLALDYLSQEQEDEDKKRLGIEKSLHETLAGCRKRLDNLTQMRLKDLIDDQEYLEQKKELLQEKHGLELNLRNGNDREKSALELTKTIFTFANQAKDRFQNGSFEDKRVILQEIGSNLFLKGRKLTVEAKKPFLFLEKGLNLVRPNIGRLEPAVCGLTKPRNGVCRSAIQLWWNTVEDVRTLYREKAASR